MSSLSSTGGLGVSGLRDAGRCDDGGPPDTPGENLIQRSQLNNYLTLKVKQGIEE